MAKKTFKDAVNACELLRESYKKELGALDGAHRNKISKRDDKTTWTGSIDLDKSVQKQCPNENRWDYGVGFRLGGDRGDRVVWIEFHPMLEDEIKSMKAKFDWLCSFLSEKAAALNALECEYVWIRSGKSEFSPNSPRAREVAQWPLICCPRYCVDEDFE